MGPGRVSGPMPRWPSAGLGRQGLTGRSGKMSAKTDGPNAVGSYLVGFALTAPRIAPVFKMYTNSRVRALCGE
jgi:hypothetical protein